MTAVQLKNLPPAEAIKYFEGKGYKLGYSWQDTWQEEHARAFTVAKAMRYDILQDIRQAMDAAIRDGTTFEDFKKRLTPVLQEKGWWGRALVADPLTGEERNVQLGSTRRLGIIFDTNMRTSYAAGHWERIQKTKAARPYLMYVAVLDGRTRPQHRAWNAIILPVDHPFWETHYPPNGWKCRCQVLQLSQRDLENMGLGVSSDADIEDFLSNTSEFRNNRTGEVTKVPAGIDPGFSYNAGRAHMKGVTPPPIDGPLGTPALNPPADLPMPPPRPAPASRLLPTGLSDEVYIDEFLGEFGASAETPQIFTDVIGDPLVISRALFERPDGRLKVTKRGRETALLLMADTIKDPDEIWWTWEKSPRTNDYTLFRRYMARFVIEGQEVPVFMLFDVAMHGWSGVTGFNAERTNYLLNQRRGTLAYRRSK
ncbi:MAG: phage head morphogenesis protein [Rhizobiales bacterium]|nr:phage head morphogenesis protein [Hyphomicrobiales bacterium]